MRSHLILHIPHSSFAIPDRYRSRFYLQGEDLLREQLFMTDLYTDELFGGAEAERLVFPISRLICDVERFRDPAAEEMTERGMWICYERCHDLRPLKTVTDADREEVLAVYDAHHLQLNTMVEEVLDEFGRCTIVDCHSYSSGPLPYELHSGGHRPQICIGADEYHSGRRLVDAVAGGFARCGYTTAINSPFSGTIVPLAFYRREPRVRSVMIEIRRDTYMDEATGMRTEGFGRVKAAVAEVIEQLRFLC